MGYYTSKLKRQQRISGVASHVFAVLAYGIVNWAAYYYIPTPAGFGTVARFLRPNALLAFRPSILLFLASLAGGILEIANIWHWHDDMENVHSDRVARVLSREALWDTNYQMLAGFVARVVGYSLAVHHAITAAVTGVNAITDALAGAPITVVKANVSLSVTSIAALYLATRLVFYAIYYVMNPIIYKMGKEEQRTAAQQLLP